MNTSEKPGTVKFVNCRLIIRSPSYIRVNMLTPMSRIGIAGFCMVIDKGKS
jgi:hypothetical protein